MFERLNPGIDFTVPTSITRCAVALERVFAASEARSEAEAKSILSEMHKSGIGDSAALFIFIQYVIANLQMTRKGTVTTVRVRESVPLSQTSGVPSPSVRSEVSARSGVIIERLKAQVEYLERQLDGVAGVLRVTQAALKDEREKVMRLAMARRAHSELEEAQLREMAARSVCMAPELHEMFPGYGNSATMILSLSRYVEGRVRASGLASLQDPRFWCGHKWPDVLKPNILLLCRSKEARTVFHRCFGGPCERTVREWTHEALARHDFTAVPAEICLRNLKAARAAFTPHWPPGTKVIYALDATSLQPQCTVSQYEVKEPEMSNHFCHEPTEAERDAALSGVPEFIDDCAKFSCVGAGNDASWLDPR
jgi:hypothetical protein